VVPDEVKGSERFREGESILPRQASSVRSFAVVDDDLGRGGPEARPIWEKSLQEV